MAGTRPTAATASSRSMPKRSPTASAAIPGDSAVDPEQRHLDPRLPPVPMGHERRAGGRHLDVRGPEIGVRPGAEGHHWSGARLAHRRDPWVVHVEDGQTVTREVGHQCALFVGHTVHIAEGDQVGGVHRSDHRDLGGVMAHMASISPKCPVAISTTADRVFGPEPA